MADEAPQDTPSTTESPQDSTDPSVDPRIAARGVAVQRDAARHRLHRVLALGVILTVVLAGGGAAASPLLDVDRVEVVGAEQTGAAQVRQAADIGTGEAMVALDGDAAVDRVEDLPWVRRAAVSRSWPGTVVVQVEERRPVAAVGLRGGGWMLVDATGRSLGQVEQLEPLIVELGGVAPATRPGRLLEARARAPLDLVERLTPALRLQLPVVRLTSDGELTARVLLPNGRAAALFGSADSLDAKVLALATLLSTVDIQGVRRIDLRDPSTPILTRS